MIDPRLISVTLTTTADKLLSRSVDRLSYHCAICGAWDYTDVMKHDRDCPVGLAVTAANTKGAA